MKKLKLIPGLILLALCVAVLGVGIYAAAPASNTITGTVTVTAASPEVEIQVYNGSTSNSIVGPTTTRTGTTIALGTLEFETKSGTALANANSPENVADIDLIFKITNNSSKKLGAYFSDTVVSQNLSEIVDDAARESKILASKDYGTGLFTVTFNQYYPINTSSTIYYIVSFHLNELSDTQQNISLGTMYLNIEEYDEDLYIAKSFENYTITTDGCVVPNESRSLSGAIYIPAKAYISSNIVNVTCIGDYDDEEDCYVGFGYNANITSVEIPYGVTTLYGNCDGVFSGCSSLASVEIPNSVTSIGDGAFSGCSSLTNVTVPGSVVTLGNSVFSDCTSLETATLLSGIRRVGEGMFSGCTNLTTVSLPDGITVLGEQAFSGCTSLASIALPSTVMKLDEEAFSGCVELTSITLTESLEQIFPNCFDGCELESVYFPEGNSEWWQAGNLNNSRTKINDNLSDASIAATCLTTTYVKKIWFNSAS